MNAVVSTQQIAPVTADQIVELYRRCQSVAWELAVACYAYVAAGGSRAELCELLGWDKGRLSRVVRVGRLYAEQPAEVQQRLESVPVDVAAETAPLVEAAPERAVEIALSGGTQRQVREAVRRARGEPVDEYRSLTVPIPRDVRPVWDQAVNLIRYLMQERDPPLSAIVERMAAEVVSLPLDAPEAEAFRDQVLSGRVVCALWGTASAAPNCAGWDATQLRYEPDSDAWFCGACTLRR